ncbi:hypothetical protein ElyMa_005442100 [Elysia marginata]|uniref:Uncharacterized protein n=1 Tax=Elysia marginata TaxID=1093978 RepID=A0AAV4EMB4_9GAST|nr:hypothetical protein ElyMa_005442100 [Elysia marginata]
MKKKKKKKKIVVPIYAHFYVVVLPGEDWAALREFAQAMLFVASFPNQEGHNYVEIYTFPTEDVKTDDLFVRERSVLLHKIDSEALFLDRSGK